MQTKDRITDAIATINYHLKAIGAILGIEQTVTTYVARHSYATVLKRAGVSTSIISESLGHSSERVTQIYLDSFDNEQMNKAMKNLL
jgi:site-specific recombinase XerD